MAVKEVSPVDDVDVEAAADVEPVVAVVAVFMLAGSYAAVMAPISSAICGYIIPAPNEQRKARNIKPLFFPSSTEKNFIGEIM